MTGIVNLNRVRKAKARAAAAATAVVNRAAFGRTKADKVAAMAETSHRDRVLDGAKRGDQAAVGSRDLIPRPVRRLVHRGTSEMARGGERGRDDAKG